MRLGPLFMTIAGLMFTLMVWTVRIARAEMSAMEVLWWRAAVGLPIALAFALPVGLRLENRRVMVYRALFGFGAMTAYYYAAKGLLLADMSILSKLQPIIVALLAPLALGRHERAGAIVWLLLAAGLAGCGILLAPDLQVGNVYGLFALVGAAASAGAHVAVRRLGSSDDPRVVVFWFQVALVALASATLAVTPGHIAAIPSPSMLPYLIGCGVFACVGQLAMTNAYRFDRASIVAAASYSAPVFAVACDWLLLDVAPQGDVLLGGAIVVGAGLVLLFRREAR